MADLKFKYNIVCIGCGGTGSFFIKEFARFMATYRDTRYEKKICMAIVDGDNVERLNLERQAFIWQDINTNKALAMAAAIRDNFKLSNILAFPAYVEEEDQIQQFFMALRNLDPNYYNYKVVNVLVSCVDNHRTRQVMHKFFDSYPGVIFYMDAANEFNRGEVVLSGKYKNKLIAPPRGYYFPNVLTDSSPRISEHSCSNVNARAAQHIVTNMMAGNILLSAVTSLISREEIRLGVAFFDAMQMQMIFRSSDSYTGEQV